MSPPTQIWPWSINGRLLLLVWFVCYAIGPCRLVPLGQSNLAFSNDIAAALTAREACVDADYWTPVTAEIAACHGEWQGHVRNASSTLCSDGFSVCSWEDGFLLRQIPWRVATHLAGCYAYDAAQDEGRCQSCREDDTQSDDLAAIGHDCPHVNVGQTGCLPDGRISARCCVDSLERKACTYAEGLTSGVLCCRRRSTPPPMPQRDQPGNNENGMNNPPMQMVRLVGERVQLHCPLAGVDNRGITSEKGGVVWFKGGNILTHAHTASWTIKFAWTLDSGVYWCRAGNTSSFAIGHINLTVNAVRTKACSDGTSDGFHDSHHVRACAGSWTGHVRRAASTLCGKGWRVCTPKDRPFLDQIDQMYLTEFGGCFGYNAAHIRKRCKKCKGRHSMAALGGDCPVNEKVGEDGISSTNTCYSNRKMTAYADKAGQPQTSRCNYRHGSGITGVMCCRRWRREATKQAPVKSGAVQQPVDSSQTSVETGNTECYPACRNGGTCLPSGQCLCPKGYTGQACQHGGCSPRCLNGGECLYGFCKCVFPFHGDHCQFSSHMPNDAPVRSETDQRTLESNKLEDSLKKRRAVPRHESVAHN